MLFAENKMDRHDFHGLLRIACSNHALRVTQHDCSDTSFTSAIQCGQSLRLAWLYVPLLIGGLDYFDIAEWHG